MTTIGQPIDRVDGALKVTGLATYAYGQWEAGQPLYGFIVGATIGKGRITGIDATRDEHLTTTTRRAMLWWRDPACKAGAASGSRFRPRRSRALRGYWARARVRR